MLLEQILITLGLISFLMKRNLFAMGFGLLLSFTGLFIWLHQLAQLKVLIFFAFLFAILMSLYTVSLVWIWRTRGSLHIDEIQEIK